MNVVARTTDRLGPDTYTFHKKTHYHRTRTGESQGHGVKGEGICRLPLKPRAFALWLIDRVVGAWATLAGAAAVAAADATMWRGFR